ncbi:MAG: primosomal protein N' [Anaerolineales bacterium]|nr:primosomal protein N' [Anaerolineales bacterium]
MVNSLFAKIAVNVPTVTGVFDYALPPELEGKIGAGHLVTVPFGKQTVQGVVLELTAEPSVAETKPVLDLLDPQPVLTVAQIALASQLAESTLNPLAAIINLMLPVGLAQQADTLFEIRESRIENRSGSRISIIESRLLDLLQNRGALRGRQIDRHFSRVDWRKTAQYLVRSGLLTSQSVLPPPSIRPKFVRTAQLAVTPETAQAAMLELGKTAETLKRRQAALRFLVSAPEPVNVSWVYAESGCNLSDLQELDERGLIVLRETEIWRDPLQRIESRGLESSEPPELTPDQQRAWEQILQAFNSFSLQPSAFLLHGVTGSGKTEIYLRAAAEAIRRGKQAIILVPEISLTPQTVRRFLARFPGQVGLVHSKLSEGERYDTWRRARLGLLKVVIGPRSALFSPLPNIGLIVADECHDGSYYQSEPPFYHAVEAAKVYARLCGAVCILGTATPSIVQRYQAEVGESVRMELPRRIPHPESEVSLACRPGQADFGQSGVRDAGLPPVQIIDMREELKSGNRGIFSRALTEALAEVLERNEQAILFLNRRGTATYVFCRECGYVAKCPNCDTPLTYHVEGDKLKVESSTVRQPSTLRIEPQAEAFNLVCHYCGYHRQLPKTCPACGSDQIRQYGLGSERVEAEVQRLFPQATTLRWDWETTRQKDAHEIILSHFVAHRADVLVGTQMLAKGLDLPLVTLVGVVLADVGLNLPDPFAAERVFQVLTQVAGRAGRSARGGQVIMQTFQPEHYAIQAAAGHDYAAFYARELQERRRLGYPPYSRLVRLEYRHYDAAKAEATAQQMAKKIQQWLTTEHRTLTTVIGPVPCFFARVAGLYRWQIVLRGPEPESLLRGKQMEGWRVEVGPVSLL